MFLYLTQRAERCASLIDFMLRIVEITSGLCGAMLSRQLNVD